MKKLYLPFWAIMFPLVANAQLDIFSEPLDKATPVDTAAYKVTYALDYTCHPLANNRFSDVRNVLIGRHTVKDFSLIPYVRLISRKAKMCSQIPTAHPGLWKPCWQ